MNAKLKLTVNLGFNYDEVSHELYNDGFPKLKEAVKGGGWFQFDGFSKDKEYPVLAVIKRVKKNDLYVLIRYDGQTISVPREWIILPDEMPVFDLSEMKLCVKEE